ncbi:MAG: YceI family protein [Flavobacteriales bacterium]|nr:YceI family protein [Flavobacteriales bacterium]
MVPFKTLLPLAAIALLSACGGQPQQPEPVVRVCRYDYNHDSTSVKWTAYKFTEKVGVSGRFDTLQVSGTSEQTDRLAVLANASFSISVASINSANAERDPKIREHFFGTMKETSVLQGRIFSMDSAMAVVELTMNGQMHPMSLAVVNSGNEVKLEGVIDLADWNATSNVEGLNKICRDLHIGPDGISKLWPEVKLEIRTVLTEVCE